MSAIFQITRDQVITGALQICQDLAKGEPADAQDLTDCTIFLQAMLKLWNVDGYKNWLFQTLTFNAVAAKASYTIGEAGSDVVSAKPLRVPQAWTTDASGNRQPLVPMVRADFERLTPRNQPGPANSCYYENIDPATKNLLKGTFYPWPVPSDTTRSFSLLCQRPIEDIGAGGSVFDIPQDAYLALIWGLAEQIGPIYCTSEKQMARIERNAPKYYGMSFDFHEEDGSVSFQPSSQMGMPR